MRHLIVATILLVFTAFPSLAVPQDTTGRAEFDSVKDYFDSIVFLPVDSINQKVDSLIAATEVAGIEAQSAAAGLAFDYFNVSPIMGSEGVSVHVAQKYFINGPLTWPDSASFPRVVTFVEFNKNSLLGQKASNFVMESLEGEPVALRNDFNSWKILYFYEPGCSTCAKETPNLITLLNRYKGPEITLYAINTSSDREQWNEYVNNHFSALSNSCVKVVNLWDPEHSTSYEKMYGVVKTPTMLLLDNQDYILGRKLNVAALTRLLGMNLKDHVEYKRLFDQIYSEAFPRSEEDVNKVSDLIVNTAGKDSTLFREIVFNLFEYLRSSRNFIIQMGAMYVAEQYIIGEPWYWSDEYAGKILDMIEKASKNPVDTKITNLLLQDKKGRYTTLAGSFGKQLNLVVFHLIKCDECEKMIEELNVIRNKLYLNGIKVIMVYAGHDEGLWNNFIGENPKKWTYVMDKTGESNMHKLFDLETVPHTYLVDGNGIIIAKDISPTMLLEIIPML